MRRFALVALFLSAGAACSSFGASGSSGGGPDAASHFCADAAAKYCDDFDRDDAGASPPSTWDPVADVDVKKLTFEAKYRLTDADLDLGAHGGPAIELYEAAGPASCVFYVHWQGGAPSSTSTRSWETEDGTTSPRTCRSRTVRSLRTSGTTS